MKDTALLRKQKQIVKTYRKIIRGFGFRSICMIEKHKELKQKAFNNTYRNDLICSGLFGENLKHAMLLRQKSYLSNSSVSI